MNKTIFTAIVALSTLTSFSQTPITIGKYTTQRSFLSSINHSYYCICLKQSYNLKL